MDRRRTFLVTALLVLLLAGTQFAPPKVVSAASSTANGGWWNSSYEFRRPLTVTNPGPSTLVNQTVIVHINFTGDYVEDPLTSVRLVNSS
ncbi:MAG TPA: hypothetical protein VEH01_03560, partial [Nitrososphaerales archaeon]|nr:hypothetical protein [Nitrososphaerales archaeon]